MFSMKKVNQPPLGRDKIGKIRPEFNDSSKNMGAA